MKKIILFFMLLLITQICLGQEKLVILYDLNTLREFLNKPNFEVVDKKEAYDEMIIIRSATYIDGLPAMNTDRKINQKEWIEAISLFNDCEKISIEITKKYPFNNEVLEDDNILIIIQAYK